MSSRREFLEKTTALTGIGLVKPIFSSGTKPFSPIVISTWPFGLKSNEEAWKIIENGGSSLNAVEKGINLCEDDPNERSVGLGGRPDRNGNVTLDACIMDSKANIGSVICLEHIVNAISVARRVMEKTPHVMLTGKGALDFALKEGFKKTKLLVPESEREWKEWMKNKNYRPIPNKENHDTIGMIALDKDGNLSGGCSTSGMAFKMEGRVGDSPIIGAGLYVDNEVGAATATGQGEEILRVAGSFLVVEFMRQGYTPKTACKKAIKRIKKLLEIRNVNPKEIQIGFIAINKKGLHGGYALQKGFSYAVKTNMETKLIEAEFLI